ncbi:MAG: hypothetical protein ACI8QS_001130 [Planctomycetota bacterium]|jgi:hypothetical protein
MAEFFENKGKVRRKWQSPREQERAWLSYEGCMVDALASKADEGRG